ncbi:MAG: hypothetical protein RR544_02535, partial [Oscillospiraceae bacterium]
GRGPATAHRGKPKPGSFGQNPYGAPYQGKGKPAGKSAGKPATGGKPASKSAAPTEQPKKIKRKAGWAKPAKKAEGLRGPRKK